MVFSISGTNGKKPLQSADWKLETRQFRSYCGHQSKLKQEDKMSFLHPTLLVNLQKAITLVQLIPQITLNFM